ncbi:MAG TPA: thiamine phosphate synthase [Dermatophilaceae bacterium]|nr:thiamine phosphate synthase [Dermatophilaceae bacterium]
MAADPGRPVDPAESAPVARPELDLSVYLVTDGALCADLGVVETVRRSVAAGASVMQVRDPQASDAEVVDLTRACVEVCLDLYRYGATSRLVPVIVNDRPDLAVEASAAGAHVGQADLDVATARRVLGPDRYLGLSVHTHAELAAAIAATTDSIGMNRTGRTTTRRTTDAAQSDLDYLGIGPLRATLSKSDHAPARGQPHLSSLAAASPWPCVVIGGVVASDAAPLRAAGLAGMAVISAICGQPDVAAATRLLVQAWRTATAGGLAS